MLLFNNKNLLKAVCIEKGTRRWLSILKRLSAEKKHMEDIKTDYAGGGGEDNYSPIAAFKRITTIQGPSLPS